MGSEPETYAKGHVRPGRETTEIGIEHANGEREVLKGWERIATESGLIRMTCYGCRAVVATEEPEAWERFKSEHAKCERTIR